MPLLKLRTWSVGLVRRPWLFTVLTVVVCASFAAHAATALVDQTYLSSVPEATPRPAAARPPAARTRLDGSQLVERNMFCSHCAPGTAPVVATLTQATLIATCLGREPYATLVVEASAVQGSWGPGDQIPGLGRLDRIAPTWIEIVDGAGRRARLSLLDAAAGRGPGTAMPANAPAALWAERIRKFDDQNYEVDRSLVRELVSGATPGGTVRPVPIFEHGAVAGIKLYGVTEGSVAAALGLKSGDALTAIDGAPIKSLPQLFDIYTRLDQLTSVELTGTRRGQPLIRTLRLR
jgi:hypothetical protein